MKEPKLPNPINRIFNGDCSKFPTPQTKLEYSKKQEADAKARGWTWTAKAWRETIEALEQEMYSL